MCIEGATKISEQNIVDNTRTDTCVLIFLTIFHYYWQFSMKLVWLFYRANDYEADSLNTYAVISSLVNSAWALGSMLGPPVAGLISQHIGFPWAATITAFAQSFMVSVTKCLTI